MLLDLAAALTPLLEVRRNRVGSGTGILHDGFDEEEAAETTLQLVFFDGEEAFKTWTDTDSIYGARSVRPPPLLRRLIQTGISPRSGKQPISPPPTHSQDDD